jgi:hypothetical protein
MYIGIPFRFCVWPALRQAVNGFAGSLWELDHAVRQRRSRRARRVRTSLDQHVAAMAGNIGDRALGFKAIDQRQELGTKPVASRGGNCVQVGER